MITLMFGLVAPEMLWVLGGLVVFAALYFLKKGSQSNPSTPEEPSVSPAPPRTQTPPRNRAVWKGLSRTRREGFIGRMASLFEGKSLSEELLVDIEEVLFTSDIGVKTADRLLVQLKEAFRRGEVQTQDEVWAFLRATAQEILEAGQGISGAWVPPASGPSIVLMVGVNGTGKTTTTGKLASALKAEGHRVLLGAGDTFRAAAVEQLQAWGKRVDVEVIAGKPESDPASVLFEAAQSLAKAGDGVLLADTAGRLHTHAGLLDELKKIVRVIGKAVAGAPHEVWLVLDGTTGQNAIQQARIFGEAVNVTGLILTKLDGTAKGGVVLGIADELKVPIRYIGVGEKAEDLRPFDAREFVEALFGTDSEE